MPEMIAKTEPETVGPRTIDLAIDRGGTFTDVWAKVPGRADVVMKLLSVNPDAYDDAPAEGNYTIYSTTRTEI